jgi:hypothetical protein
MRPPTSLVPYLDTLTDAELGALLRAAVGIVRDEGGHERDDATVQVEVRVTLRGQGR